MIIKKIEDVPAVPVEMEGANDVSMRVIFGPKDGAPTFAMRQFELAPSGCTPFHAHPFEHQVVIMQGEIAVVSDGGGKRTQVTVGDVVMVMAGEEHQFVNLWASQGAKMLCFVPIKYQK